MKRVGLLFLFSAGLFAQSQSSLCDLNHDSQINVVDVQIAVNQALGLSHCTGDVDGDGICTVIDVQRVIAAALGGVCDAGTTTTGGGGGNSRGTNGIVVYESDGTGQINRPITLGRVFRQGDIPACPQPVVGTTPLTNYQADVKNRWPDGSVKFAIISFTQTLGANGSVGVTFQNSSSCNNSGYLNQGQMLGFNNGAWDAEIDATAAGTGQTKTAEAKAMLGASDPGTNAQIGSPSWPDCKNDYWLQGPVVTAVIVQDCSATSAFDFGWHWDGTTMGSLSTANGTYASLHPYFILYFYPAINSVRVEYVIENAWTGRWQDQLFDLVLKAGSPLSTIYGVTGSARKLSDVSITSGSKQITSASGNFTANDLGQPIQIGRYINTTICTILGATTVQLCSPPSTTATNQVAYIGLMNAGQRYRKTFWSGAGTPGNILVDHNFQYLTATKALPNYDQSVTASPDSKVLQPANCNDSDYNCFVNFTDKGDRGGRGNDVWQGGQGFSGNDEGAPVQREDLLYLYNMGVDCGSANGKCSKAWYLLTGTRGDRDFGLAPSVAGGAGMWGNQGNLPIHGRESRTAPGSYYCPAQADVNANSETPCGPGVGNPTGKALSKYYAPNDQFYGTYIAAVGKFTAGNWNVDCPHWLDYSYVPYLLTGDYYFLEEEYQGASYCQFSTNVDSGNAYGMGRFFSYLNPIAARAMAWPLQTTAHAAFIAPDNTPEQSYYISIVNSNLEVQEGFRGLTGTPLTPASTNATCSNYNYQTATRWDWGACTIRSQCYNTGATCSPVVAAPSVLHMPNSASCPMYPAVDTINAATNSSTVQVTTLGGHENGTDTYTIFGGTGNWARLNGNYVFTKVSGQTYRLTPNVDTTGWGPLTGYVGVVAYEAGQITAATSGNPTVLTGATTAMSGYPVEIYGATGGWLGLNGQFTITTRGDAQHYSIPLALTALTQPLLGQVYWNFTPMDFTKASDFVTLYHYWFLAIAMGHIQELGVAASSAAIVDQYKMLVDMVNNGNIDANGNPYFVSMYVAGVRDASAGYQCLLDRDVSTRNPFFTSWSQFKAAFTPDMQKLSTFDHPNSRTPNFPCADHGYSLLARAAGTFARNVNTMDGCAGGTCSGSAAWAWLSGYVPYFNNSPPTSAGCGTWDGQIKFALAPR
ncbi:MAG TPA: hypothetical protein VJN43_12210 [Bryobacteraceae bacterium]|nr:hypothetical protein [Bryobacteraceae bacterium]